MNGIIHVVCKIFRNVMLSFTESELGSLFVNYQDAAPISTTLIEMNHLQPPTPIKVENSTAVVIDNGAIKYMVSKEMDIRFYWIWCRKNQYQLIVYWEPGKGNLGDYPNNHHSTAHNIMVRPVYLHYPKSPNSHAVRVYQLCHKCAYIVHVITVIWTQKTYYTRVIIVIRKQCTYCMHVITAIWSHNNSHRELSQTVSLTVIQSLLPMVLTSYGPFNRFPDVIGVPLGGQRNQQQATNLFTQNPTLDRIFTNLVTTLLSSSFDAVNRCI